MLHRYSLSGIYLWEVETPSIGKKQNIEATRNSCHLRDEVHTSLGHLDFQTWELKSSKNFGTKSPGDLLRLSNTRLKPTFTLFVSPKENPLPSQHYPNPKKTSGPKNAFPPPPPEALHPLPLPRPQRGAPHKAFPKSSRQRRWTSVAAFWDLGVGQTPKKSGEVSWKSPRDCG